MTKTKEEVMDGFSELFDQLNPAEKAFVRAAFTGEGLNEAVSELIGAVEIEEEGWGEPYGPLVVCTDDGCPCDKE